MISEANLECLLALEKLSREDIFRVIQPLKKRQFHLTRICVLKDSIPQDLETLNVTEAFKQCEILCGEVLIVTMKGIFVTRQIEISICFELNSSVVAISVGAEHILEGGCSTRRFLEDFFSLLQEIVVQVPPSYAYLGPEYYYGEDIRIQSAEKNGFIRFRSDDFFSLSNLEEIESFYDHMQPL